MKQSLPPDACQIRRLADNRTSMHTTFPLATSMTQVQTSTNDSNSESSPLNRIVKRYGGRHLIFRTKLGGWWIVPHSYVLVSSFRGPVWVFYGAGQIWLTHKKHEQIGGWTARIPRFKSKAVTQILEAISSELETFINQCNELGIEGTVVIERKVIEFHWTFGHDDEVDERHKENSSELLDHHFQNLVNAYLAAKKELAL